MFHKGEEKVKMRMNKEEEKESEDIVSRRRREEIVETEMGNIIDLNRSDISELSGMRRLSKTKDRRENRNNRDVSF